MDMPANTTLPRSVATYIAGANAQDIDTMTSCFAEDAVVRDEGQSREGTAAIREWAEEVSRKYNPMIEVVDVAAADHQTVFTGRVSGSFPGSPVDLRFAFSLNGEKVVRLEIS
jgi:hypothetical protein